MNYYQREIEKIKNSCYANQAQIETVIATRRYINNNFGDQLNLNSLARTQHTSKFHLLRLFKKYYGQTPKQYLIDKRIEIAKIFLRSGLTVAETCYEIGFESPSSFCTLFKVKVGFTPTEFQKRATFTKPV